MIPILGQQLRGLFLSRKESLAKKPLRTRGRKAREGSIAITGDVAEITKRKSMKKRRRDKIAGGTWEVPLKEGGTRSVPTIESTLA